MEETILTKGMLVDEKPNFVELATELTIAWLSNPNTRADDEAIPKFLVTTHAALLSIGASTSDAPEAATSGPSEYRPAISAKKSLASPDRIISMIDGKPYTSLRRHLTAHGLTPDQYRARYNLKPDYPMVAPAYSEARREMAKRIGLGRKPKTIAPPPSTPSETTPAAPPARRKRGASKK